MRHPPLVLEKRFSGRLPYVSIRVFAQFYGEVKCNYVSFLNTLFGIMYSLKTGL